MSGAVGSVQLRSSRPGGQGERKLSVDELVKPTGGRVTLVEPYGSSGEANRSEREELERRHDEFLSELAYHRCLPVDRLWDQLDLGRNFGKVIDAPSAVALTVVALSENESRRRECEIRKRKLRLRICGPT